MRPIRTLLVGTARAAVWPGYLALAAYAARQAPWPRSIALALGTFLGLLALAALAVSQAGWLFGKDGWVETFLGVPRDVCRQARRTAYALVGAHALFLIPVWLLSRGLIMPGGRPLMAPALVRGLVLAFEVVVLGIAFRVTRPVAPLFTWLTQFPERLGWLTRRRRAVSLVVLGVIVLVIALDARGYSFSARRLATGMAGSLVIACVCWGLHRLSLGTINRHAWRWVRLGKTLAGFHAADSRAIPDDLAARLRRLSGYLAAGFGLYLASWVWDVDLALFEFISGQELWTVVDKEVYVTVGDLTRAVVIVALTASAWKHMSTVFAVAVFPRMPDDPGVRFAVVMLCRYAVLGIGLIAALSALHLGLEKIGVVLAALGVGLGFGLQEIVSNFVCGIILLLERPIRVGDIVTVAGMNGKVDRINIRATTIINGDNQSIIVPNRAFITGDLVNWTLKDKVIRLTLRVKVALGTDPDRVAELLLGIARDDADVLRNPLPAAFMEELSDSALLFVLHVHVPDPSLAGRVRHRLFAQIQRRFEAEGVKIPYPTHKLLVKPAEGTGTAPFMFATDFLRVDGATGFPTPHLRPGQVGVEVEEVGEGHRGVDE